MEKLIHLLMHIYAPVFLKKKANGCWRTGEEIRGYKEVYFVCIGERKRKRSWMTTSLFDELGFIIQGRILFCKKKKIKELSCN